MASALPAPRVIIAGAGLAGLAAAHRLLERGCDVTLIEADDFIGGKLGGHRDVGADAGGACGPAPGSCPDCAARGGCARGLDWHEHCYHMYLNWYHNFWALMNEIGALGNFIRAPSMFNIPRAADMIGAGSQPAIPLFDVGSPWTVGRNMVSGLGCAADMFLAGQTMADLISEPVRRDDWLEKTSVAAFMKSRPYATPQALAGTYRTTAQAFASPSYLSSARSFKTLLSYSLRLPEPMMWLLAGSTALCIFAPWLARLAALAGGIKPMDVPTSDPEDPFRAVPRNAGSRLAIHMLTTVEGLRLDEETGLIAAIDLARCARSPSIHRGDAPAPPTDRFTMTVEGDLILAVPLDTLGRLVTPQIARRAPALPEVNRLRTEPMIALDLYFRRKLPGIQPGITVLLDSPYEMSFLDTAQIWRDGEERTRLNIIASSADALVPSAYRNADIAEILIGELRRYLAFDRSDILDCRTHLQTNVGESLFVNQVGSWEWRPQAASGIANLYIAGDYCQTAVDVVTIEGAVVSGLMAAEALRRHRRIGWPIAISQPDRFPLLPMAALAAATRPFAYPARAASAADAAIRRLYERWFPNG